VRPERIDQMRRQIQRPPRTCLITPEASNCVIARAWGEDAEKVSWCEEHTPPGVTPERLLEVIALDRWLSLDPVFQGPLTLASLADDLPRI
jgi:hypothetical protein